MKLFEIKLLKEVGPPRPHNYKNNITTMIKRGNFLFRGMKSHDGMQNAGILDIDAFFIKPRESDRVPLGSALAFAISNSWDDLPKRSRSAFATGKQKETIGFGIPYLCIPRDDTKSFGCIEWDFNFTDGEEKISRLNYKLGYLFGIVKRVIAGDTFKDNDTAQKLKGALDSVQIDSRGRPLFTQPNTLAALQQVVDVAPKIFDDNTTEGQVIIQDVLTIKSEMEKLAVKSLTHLLDSFPPEFFGVTHTTSLADIPKNIGEVWWEGEYLMVEMGDNTPKEILQQLINEIG